MEGASVPKIHAALDKTQTTPQLTDPRGTHFRAADPEIQGLLAAARHQGFPSAPSAALTPTTTEQFGWLSGRWLSPAQAWAHLGHNTRGNAIKRWQLTGHPARLRTATAPPSRGARSPF
jgi:hypothetical protein